MAAIPLRVSCINKNPRFDPYNRITHIGGNNEGVRWRYTLDAAISYIEGGHFSFYTYENGHHRPIHIAFRLDRKYLKTVADADTPDNLLYLPECPPS